jgi:4-amino-4-deoxy-L-arabinose transferase-like glycosyltransferase
MRFASGSTRRGPVFSGPFWRGGRKKTRYIPWVRQLVRQNLRFFAVGTLAALALRLFFLLKFPQVTTDSRFYADLARNWLQHRVFGLTIAEGILPTAARLPGYPAFLALMFATFGVDRFTPVLVVQILVDVATCFVIADLARRCLSPRAAKAAFLLAGLCPFLANYSAAALTETFEVFFTALALDLAVAGLDGFEAGDWPAWAGCGFAVGACILLRPDGGLLLIAITAYLGILLLRRRHSGETWVPLMRAGVIVGVCALAPLGLWGVRNWHTLHHLRFLPPRYANEEDEFVSAGFNRWVKTWIADYVSTEEIYWNVPGSAIDVGKLPSRAVDSLEQCQKSYDLIEQYNQATQMSANLDGQFSALAQERIRDAPARYYLWLPALRIADMWLRPRTELLPPDSRWYEFTDDLRWMVQALGLAAINLLYVGGAIAGGIRGRPIAWVGLFVLFVVLRSLFLGTLENPEPRYTLECYPVVIVLASGLWKRAK